VLPNSADAYYYMGRAQADLGQEGKALQAFETAVAKDPKHGAAQKEIGQILYDRGKKGEALPHLEAASKVGQATDPWLPDAYFLLGRAADEKGNKKLAAQAYLGFLKVAPVRHPMRSDVEKKLKELGAVPKTED